MGGLEPFQLSERMSWKTEAAVGVPHAVCPAGTPSMVAALEL